MSTVILDFIVNMHSYRITCRLPALGIKSWFQLKWRRCPWNFNFLAYITHGVPLCDPQEISANLVLPVIAIGFPFAKFFFLCASVLREKTTICAIIRKSHFAKNCPIPLLRNSSFAQFRNFLKIKRFVTTCVFLRTKFWKILFWNVFLLVTFT